MFSVDWDRDSDCPIGTVSFEGIASLQKLQHDVENTLVLRKGAIIPGTRAQLQADNYGIHFRNLYHDFDEFVKFVTEQTPPDFLTENYPNPYTGDVLRKHKTDESIVESVSEKLIPGVAPEITEQPVKVSNVSFVTAVWSWIRQKIGW